MRTSQERVEAARQVLSDLFVIDDCDERILVGPWPIEEEFSEIIDINPMNAGTMDYMAHDILSALTGEKIPCAANRAELSAFQDRIAEEALNRHVPIWVRDDGISLYSVEDAGQIAIDLSGERPRLAGVYFGSALHVEPDYRRRKISADLIIEQLLDQGSLSVWSLDKCAFSLEGEKAHFSALRALREMALDPEISPSPE